MRTVTADEVKIAQRVAPQSEATKELQRAYQSQLNDEERQKKAAEYRAKKAATDAEITRLRQALTKPRTMIAGFRLVLMSITQAQWAGMAPSVAGGWVAVALPRVGRLQVALVPEDWTTYVRESDIETVAKLWADECIDLDEYRDALDKINGCTEGSM